MANPLTPQPITTTHPKEIQETLADLLANVDQISDLLTDILDVDEADVFATLRKDILSLQFALLGRPLTRIGPHYKPRKAPRQPGNSTLQVHRPPNPTPHSPRAQMITTDTPRP